MKASYPVLFLFLLTFSGLHTQAFGQEGHVYQAGVASVDITPNTAIRLNGFGGRTEESEGVRQPLFAKALTIGSTDQDTIVILTVDTLGIPDDLKLRVIDKLQHRLELTEDRVVICASHTHSGPMIVNCANTLFGRSIPDDQWQRIVSYTNQLEDQLVSVTEDAWRKRRPSRLSWGLGNVRFAMNRRTSGGPVDHDLPVLAVHDLQGTLTAVFTNYACHCVTLSDNLISGDWVGYAMEHIQRQHPGCEALISIGCGADSNPRGGVLGGRSDIADSLGLELAQEVTSVLNSELTPLKNAPAALLERVSLPLAPLPTRAQWEEQSRQPNAVGYHAAVQLRKLDRGEPLVTEISYPVQSIHFGDQLALLFLPGEVVVDYSLRLKKELRSSRLWVNAYANACPGYVPSERILREGGYEGGGAMVYYDIPGPYAAGVEQIIIDAVHRQLSTVIPAKSNLTDRYSGEGTDGIRPLAPESAVRSLQPSPGFRAELAVSEPLVQSPVAIAFGPDGTLWVAEMTDYPRPAETGNGSAEGTHSPLEGRSGQVRRLTDTDRDGEFDHSTVFLDEIPFPTGVTVWRDGILVCAAPDILFAQDTDADGKADRIEKLFTGFATHSFQARVNSLEYGLDGWLYGSCGLFGGDITSLKTGKVVSLGQRDFRCQPDTGVFEPAAGATQQGRVRNDQGDWFGCNNSVLLMHYPLEEHYLRRNPFLSAQNNAVSLLPEPTRGRLFPVSAQVLFALSGPPGNATAACGTGIYRDTLFGPMSSGNAFTCEPVNNLVHRQQLIEAGATFRSVRAETEQQQEFVASSDPWFRPVQARTGPDGALWIVDMYRYVIEHPIWIPPATLATLDPRAGADLGRIYRIEATGQPLRHMPDLTRVHGSQLAALMNTPNGVQRDLVQQLILWNNDRDAIPGLRELCLLESAPAAVRIQAASTWSCLETLPVSIITTLLASDDATVRRHAIRLSEPLLQESRTLDSHLTDLKNDSSPRVRFQLACSIAHADSPAVSAILTYLLSSNESDEFIRLAAESSLNAVNSVEIFHQLRKSLPPGKYARQISLIASLADPSKLPDMLDTLLSDAVEVSDRQRLLSLLAFFQGLQVRTLDADQKENLQNRPLTDTVSGLTHQTALNEAANTSERIAALQLLTAMQPSMEETSNLLLQLLSPQTPSPLQTAAVESLSQIGHPETANRLIADWDGLSPDLRLTLVTAFLQRSEWTLAMLRSIQTDVIHRSELNLLQQQQLLNHPDEQIRTAANKCLQQIDSTDRQEVINRFTAAINSEGIADDGAAVFRKHCSTCHQLRESGVPVGPDISNYSGKPPLALVTAIMDPNQAVDPRYLSYAVVLRDGRTLSGLITSESDNGLIVLSPEGKRHSLLRSEIETLRSTGKSLMPEGLHQNLTISDVNHLWAWLRTQQLPPKSIDGNQPQLIPVPATGNAVLSAISAEIFGEDITFEIPFSNIGYWHGPDDFVQWKLRSEKSREMVLWAEWACHPDSSGNELLVQGPNSELKAKVESTGGWDRYQLQMLGNVTIPEGEFEFKMRPAVAPRGALADLRALHLVELDGVPLARGMVHEDPVAQTIPKSPDQLAAFILNDSIPESLREAAIAENIKRAHKLLPLLVEGLPTTPGSDEEYRRIPWIWRLAIATGKTGDPQEIRQLLKVSLPEIDQSLQHWQAVVLGGGLVNGISLSNRWPQAEIQKSLDIQPDLNPAWSHALQQAALMTTAESIPPGTRYDALRMVALLDWSVAAPLLEKHLSKDSHPELQMGAVSGLSDVPETTATTLLIAAWGNLSESNQGLAIDALTRSPQRCLETLKALEDGRLPESLKAGEKLQSLLEHPSDDVKSMASRVLR